MATIPRDQALDSSLALLREGYEFIPNRCRRYQTDIFETRLMLRNAVCMMGEEAAAQFYTPERFTRRGAFPPTTLWLLQDTGSVQLLDDDDHHWRKRMFMSLMTPESIERLADTMEALWRYRLRAWEGMERVVLDHEAQKIFTRAVCAWAGLPLTPDAAKRRTQEMWAMIDGAGTFGPRTLWGLLQRSATERWAGKIIARVRAGQLEVAEGTATHVIAWHRDRAGRLLDPGEAVVELLNVLRPTAAVARYVTFAALALHDHPESRPQLLAGDDANLTAFVHEVRRFYPFFPFIAGHVLKAFDWRNSHFAEGAWVLLNLYGTNHDPRTWTAPETFRPDRFRHWDGSPFDFIPQGGGDHDVNHRCAGEWITIALMKRAVRLLTTAMTFDVPEQDLSIDLSRMPAMPRSGFVMTNVRAMA